MAALFHRRLQARSIPLAAFCLVFLVQCAGFYRKAGEIMVSDQDEMKIGAQFNQTLLTNDTAKQEYPLYVPRNQAQSEFQNYITSLAQQIVAAVPDNQRPKYNFTFTIIDKDVENAFAVPGGYVYIYTGIIKKIKDESELTAILGHEITHVTHHHFRQSLAKQETLGLALQALLGATNSGQAAQMAAGTAFQLIGLRFSRENESEADVGGTLLAARTGHNPLGVAKFFARNRGPNIPQWLSDHPGSPNRVKAVEKIVNSNPDYKRLAADSAQTNFTQNFQSHVAGM